MFQVRIATVIYLAVRLEAQTAVHGRVGAELKSRVLYPIAL